MEAYGKDILLKGHIREFCKLKLRMKGGVCLRCLIYVLWGGDRFMTFSQFFSRLLVRQSSNLGCMKPIVSRISEKSEAPF